MNIFVRVLVLNKLITIEMDLTDNILKIKEKIRINEDFHVDEQLLIFDNNELQDDKLLSEYNIQEHSILFLVTKK